ncbi:MAG: TetR/AcrR family transcriptional regulator [Anaerolineae bacterium]
MSREAETRRAERAMERRQRILEAAAAVFAHKGFERATTREIAEAAEVSEGTIYNYFASKQQLLVALAQMIQDKLGAIVPKPSASGDDRHAIVRAIEEVLAVIAENAVVIKGLLTALWDQGYGFHGYLLPGAKTLITQVEDYLKARMAVGAIRACDAHIVARMVMGMVIYLAVPYIQGVEPMPSPEQRHQQAELLVSILLQGLKA